MSCLRKLSPVPDTTDRLESICGQYFSLQSVVTARHPAGSSHGSASPTYSLRFCNKTHYLPLSTTMSKLNAGAFEFVPGRGFGAPQPPQPPPPAPIERPEQTEAPRPPPTISLNIGGAKPTPPAPAPAPAASAPAPAAAAPPAASIVKTAPAAAPSKTFSTEKSKTDTTAIAKEVRTVADDAVLEDLYGDGMYRSPPRVPLFNRA